MTLSVERGANDSHWQPRKKPQDGSDRAIFDAIAQLSQLRLVRVNGPCSVLLSAEAYTGLSETRTLGIRCGSISSASWTARAKAHSVLTTRGGDIALHVGRTYPSVFDPQQGRLRAACRNPTACWPSCCTP
jgi:uncharacterized linocin/CFP29 family protein